LEPTAVIEGGRPDVVVGAARPLRPAGLRCLADSGLGPGLCFRTGADP